MKRILIIMLVFIFFTGCAKDSDNQDLNKEYEFNNIQEIESISEDNVEDNIEDDVIEYSVILVNIDEDNTDICEVMNYYQYKEYIDKYMIESEAYPLDLNENEEGYYLVFEKTFESSYCDKYGINNVIVNGEKLVIEVYEKIVYLTTSDETKNAIIIPLDKNYEDIDIQETIDKEYRDPF